MTMWFGVMLETGDTAMHNTAENIGGHFIYLFIFI